MERQVVMDWSSLRKVNPQVWVHAGTLVMSFGLTLGMLLVILGIVD
jgi:hypothetical protein